MSGKFEKKKVSRIKKESKILIAVAAILLVCIVAIFMLREIIKTEQEVQLQMTEAETSENAFDVVSSTVLHNALEVIDVGSYTGVYMEDGTDELVSKVLMIKLINNSDDTVEYAKFTMNVDGKTAEFTVSTLKPRETIVLLEKNRMEYDDTVDYSEMQVVCENLAVFKEPLSAQEDKLKIQILDGAINVTNISNEDIQGQISIYYKNKAAGIYYGGITYRITLENGLKAGEIRQLMASHFSETGSEIVFVTIKQ